ncbi:MAG: hypothetical protein AAGN66_15540 [Acidobacteriota bacterium]
MKKLFLFFVALTALAWALWPAKSGAQESGYVVIVNSSNATSTLTRDQVSDFLLKKKGKWQSGSAVKPADLDSQSPVRAAMSKAIHGRSVASIKNYWQRQIFSGRDVPPPEMPSDARMVAFVAGSPGGIGYVSSGARLNGVKAVEISE